jgi:hypothetical protein
MSDYDFASNVNHIISTTKRQIKILLSDKILNIEADQLINCKIDNYGTLLIDDSAYIGDIKDNKERVFKNGFEYYKKKWTINGNINIDTIVQYGNGDISLPDNMKSKLYHAIP